MKADTWAWLGQVHHLAVAHAMRASAPGCGFPGTGDIFETITLE